MRVELEVVEEAAAAAASLVAWCFASALRRVSPSLRPKKERQVFGLASVEG